MIQSIKVFIKVKEIKRDYFILNKNEMNISNNVPSEIKYVGLDSKGNVLKEYFDNDNGKAPRNLFYTLETLEGANNNNSLENDNANTNSNPKNHKIKI